MVFLLMHKILQERECELQTRNVDTRQAARQVEDVQAQQDEGPKGTVLVKTCIFGSFPEEWKSYKYRPK